MVPHGFRTGEPVEIANLIVTSTIALIGLFVANSFRRQRRLKVAELRVEAYRKLWTMMETARPSRLMDGVGPLTEEEAGDLYMRMSHWYYKDGSGMLLTEETKRLYLVACRRLYLYSQRVDEAGDDGARRIRELSILRTQMTRDLEPLDAVSVPDHGDAEFLREAAIDPVKWARPPWHRRIANFTSRRP
jgi:hypothetical protein